MATFTWKTGVRGDWTDAADWENNAVPTASDSVEIPQDDSFGTEVSVTSPISVGSIDNGAYLSFNDAGSCRVSGDLASHGVDLSVDATSLAIGGELRLEGAYHLFSLGGRVTAGSLDVTNFFEVQVADGARLRVNGPASFGTAGTLTGDIDVFSGGRIEFAGTSQITTIAESAYLTLSGTADIADTDLGVGSNSALTGLSTIGGTLDLSGSTVTTNGSLTVTRHGEIIEDTGPFSEATHLSIGGTLVNRGFIVVGGAMGLTTDLSAHAVDNRGAAIVMNGPGTLDVGGPASFGTRGVVDGRVDLTDALIEFSGTAQLTTINTGAALSLFGMNAFIADTGLGLESNSALTGLTTIKGALTLTDGAEIDASGALTVESGGAATLDSGTLTTAGVLHNLGTISEGRSGHLEVGVDLVNAGIVGLGSRDRGSLTVDGTLRNDGTVTDTGSGHLNVDGALVNTGLVSFGRIGSGTHDQLDIAGRTTNDGMMKFHGGTETFSAAVDGTGSFGLGVGTTLGFDAAVGEHETFNLRRNDVLDLSDANDFHASVRNFTQGDAYLFDAFDSSTTFNFVENASQTGGVLTVSDGSMEAHIHMRGVYDNGDFSLSAMQGGGVKISSTR